jgi:hypothetical protein
MRQEGESQADPIGTAPPPSELTPDSPHRHTGTKRRNWRIVVVSGLAVTVVLATLVVGLSWQINRHSERFTLGGGGPSVYNENLTFPWESRVTVTVDDPTGFLYGYFGNAQGMGYLWSNGACSTNQLDNNGSTSCTVGYSGGAYVVQVEDLVCGGGLPPCPATDVNLTFSWAAL